MDSRPDGYKLLAPIVPGLNRFSQKLFEYLCLEEKNNLVISPIGISTLLAMVALGAKGQSLAELQSTLRLPKSHDTCYAGYEVLDAKWNRNNKSRDPSFLHVCHKFVTSDRLKIEDKFHTDTLKYFASIILSVNWEDKNEICEEVNKFCKDKTKGRICSILSPPDAPELPSLILLNAVYLEEAWGDRLVEVLTKSEPFYVNSELKVEVSMMHITGLFDHGEIPELDAKFVVLQLSDTPMKMMVILPNKLNGMTELKQYLSTLNFTELLKPKKNSWIKLSLPKFRVENSVNLTETLKKMGLKHVCEKGKADFTGVSSTLPICVDGVFQKTFLDVNERGINIDPLSSPCMGMYVAPDMEFEVNRPFICAIIADYQDWDFDITFPIFMAKINNPTL